MTATATPLRAAAAGAVAAVVLGLGAGYAWGSHAESPRTVALAAAGSPAGADASAAGITVTGTGTMSGTPDTLRLDLGVSIIRPSVTAALDAANTATADVQAALRKHGVADEDLRTSGLSVQPRYADGGDKAPVVTGYQVDESVTAILRDLRAAGDTISAAARAGGDATRISSVGLDLSDTGPLVTAARGKAFARAKQKAQQYAEAAGVSLGDVVSVSEQTSGSTPVPYPADGVAAGRSVPVAAGSQQVGVTVTVVFGIG